MDKLLNISSSPHVRNRETTGSIMSDVLIALIPATGFAVYKFGLHAFIIILVSVIFSMACEAVFQKGMGRKITITDGSAAVTGLLLALNMPPTIPIWIVMIGCFVAIIIVKQLFGGLGQNFMNPALAARCFLLIAFTGRMTAFTYDGVSTATPLASLKNGESVKLIDLFLGNIGGSIGEICVPAILLGAAYLLVKRVISFRIPLSYIVSFSIFMIIFGGHGFDLEFLAAQLCAGGLMLGAFFMATDYVTSPITPDGRIVYGIFIGILTGIFRVFGNGVEGVSYAIICGNMISPLIEKVTKPRVFGVVKVREKTVIEVLKSSKKDKKKTIIILTCITLVAGLVLGYIYDLTKEPIAAQNELTSLKAYKSIYPNASDFTSVISSKDYDIVLEEMGDKYGNIVLDDVLEVKDSSGSSFGKIIAVTSKDGFGGNIKLYVGVNIDGTTSGVQILEINETAGLGMNAQNEDFLNQYKNKTVSEFTLVKGEISSDDQISALSGATITSTAVTNAVNAAIYIANADVSDKNSLEDETAPTKETILESSAAKVESETTVSQIQAESETIVDTTENAAETTFSEQDLAIRAQNEANLFYKTIYPTGISFVSATSDIDYNSLVANSGLPFGNVTVDNIYVKVLDEAGNIVGNIISVTSADGMDGKSISLLVGLDKLGSIQGIEYTNIDELEANQTGVKNPDFINQFKNKSVTGFYIVSDTPVDEAQIGSTSDNVTTVSAIINAVNAVLYVNSQIN